MTNTITRNLAAACTAFAAVFAVSNVQATEPTGDVDAHAAVRSQILGAWQPVQAPRGAREAELIPALDAHEQARRAVLSLVSHPGNPLRGVAAYAPLDNHERARRHILGLPMEADVQAAEPVENLWFTDSHVTAFYAVDEANYRMIVATEPGPQDQGHATRTERQLVDGERFAISLDGHGSNALTATLAVTRSGNDLDVRITTTPRERSLAARN